MEITQIIYAGNDWGGRKYYCTFLDIEKNSYIACLVVGSEEVSMVVDTCKNAKTGEVRNLTSIEKRNLTKITEALYI